MSRYRFDLATPADDAELRSVLAQTPMDGDIRVSFRREPSYFRAAQVEGEFLQVVAARESAGGQIVGFGCRSIHERYVNGCPRPIGYLSGLRLLPPFRSGGLLARGFRFFRELHDDGRAPFYLTTIADGNDVAAKALVSGRAELPTYAYQGQFHTFVLPVTSSWRHTARADCRVRPAEAGDVPRLSEFLNRHGPQRQFFPRYRSEDFFSTTGLLRDLQCCDLLLAFRGGELCGTLGGWDQHGFRQSVVHEYSRRLQWSRPIYNRVASWRGRPVLPPPGSELRYLTAVLPVVADDDPTVFASLLDTLLSQAAGGPAKHILLGLHERDPLRPVAQKRQAACYTTNLYLVYWDDGQAMLSELDDRVPYLELGSL
jgi:hypothetical protein